MGVVQNAPKCQNRMAVMNDSSKLSKNAKKKMINENEGFAPKILNPSCGHITIDAQIYKNVIMG